MATRRSNAPSHATAKHHFAPLEEFFKRDVDCDATVLTTGIGEEWLTLRKLLRDKGLKLRRKTGKTVFSDEVGTGPFDVVVAVGGNGEELAKQARKYFIDICTRGNLNTEVIKQYGKVVSAISLPPKKPGDTEEWLMVVLDVQQQSSEEDLADIADAAPAPAAEPEIPTRKKPFTLEDKQKLIKAFTDNKEALEVIIRQPTDVDVIEGRAITAEDIAAVCYDVNITLQRLFKDPVSPPWEEASEHIKASCLEGVLNIKRGAVTRAGGSHAGWYEFKKAAGWTYGPVKDEVKKEHPCMVPFEDLPVEQQLKDHIFLAICKSLLGVTTPTSDVVDFGENPGTLL